MSKTPYTDQQLRALLRGLLTVAWTDGHYEADEQAVVSQITHELTFDGLESQISPDPISGQELAEVFGHDPKMAENFIRSAVLMAIADGIYSPAEFKLIHEYSDALGLKLEALSALEETLCDPSNSNPDGLVMGDPHPDLLHPVKHWLDDMEIHDPRLARFLCKMIPAQCPLERDICLFGHKIVHIPPMCKINPLYDQLMGLRFRSLSYLADECKEDISGYVK